MSEIQTWSQQESTKSTHLVDKDSPSSSPRLSATPPTSPPFSAWNRATHRWSCWSANASGPARSTGAPRCWERPRRQDCWCHCCDRAAHCCYCCDPAHCCDCCGPTAHSDCHDWRWPEVPFPNEPCFFRLFSVESDNNSVRRHVDWSRNKKNLLHSEWQKKKSIIPSRLYFQGQSITTQSSLQFSEPNLSMRNFSFDLWQNSSPGSEWKNWFTFWKRERGERKCAMQQTDKCSNSGHIHYTQTWHVTRVPVKVF